MYNKKVNNKQNLHHWSLDNTRVEGYDTQKIYIEKTKQKKNVQLSEIDRLKIYTHIGIIVQFVFILQGVMKTKLSIFYLYTLCFAINEKNLKFTN